MSNKAGKAQKAEPCPRDKTFNTVFGQREEQTGRAASCTSPAGVLSPLRDKTNVELATVGPSRSSSYGEDSSPPAPRGLDKGKGKAPNQDEIPEQTFDPRGDPANGFLDCLQAYLETIPEHERAQLDIQPYESEEDQPAQETDFEDSFRAHLQTIPEHERAPLDFEPLVRTKGPVSAPDGSNLDKGVGPSRLREAVLRSGPKEIHRTTGRDDESDYDSEAPDSDDEIDADTEFRDDVPELVDLLDDDSDHALDVDDDRATTLRGSLSGSSRHPVAGRACQRTGRQPSRAESSRLSSTRQSPAKAQRPRV